MKKQKEKKLVGFSGLRKLILIALPFFICGIFAIETSTQKVAEILGYTPKIFVVAYVLAVTGALLNVFAAFVVIGFYIVRFFIRLQMKKDILNGNIKVDNNSTEKVTPVKTNPTKKATPVKTNPTFETSVPPVETLDFISQLVRGPQK